jgi:hypothetical protein
MKLLFGIVLLQGIVQNLKLVTVSLEIHFWQRLLFMDVRKEIFYSSEITSFFSHSSLPWIGSSEDL